jgi:hypothetical protein
MTRHVDAAILFLAILTPAEGSHFEGEGSGEARTGNNRCVDGECTALWGV